MGMRVQAVMMVASLCVVGSGCTSVGDKLSAVLFPAHPDSWERRGESVEVRLLCASADPVVTRPVQGDVHPRAAAAPALAMAAEVAVGAAVEFLREEAERYSASYSGLAMGDAFYRDQGDDINLTGIEMVRMLEQDIPSLGGVQDAAPLGQCTAFDGSVSTTREGELAMRLLLDVKPTRDGTAFVILPKEVVIHQAKAKIHLFNWFEPWTWIRLGAADDDIDVLVKVVLHAAWTDEDGKGFFEKRGEGEFKIRNLKLGTPYARENSEHPLPGGTLEGQLIPAIPRSVLSGGGRGLGNYVVSILVTEVDDYGSKIKEQADRLEKEREGLIERVTSFAE